MIPQQLLRNINVERDVSKKREVIKKVIAYMTLGIDVSRLFSEMVLASQAQDLVIKKMVNLNKDSTIPSTPNAQFIFSPLSFRSSSTYATTRRATLS